MQLANVKFRAGSVCLVAFLLFLFVSSLPDCRMNDRAVPIFELQPTVVWGPIKGISSVSMFFLFLSQFSLDVPGVPISPLVCPRSFSHPIKMVLLFFVADSSIVLRAWQLRRVLVASRARTLLFRRYLERCLIYKRCFLLRIFFVYPKRITTHL